MIHETHRIDAQLLLTSISSQYRAIKSKEKHKYDGRWRRRKRYMASSSKAHDKFANVSQRHEHESKKEDIGGVDLINSDFSTSVSAVLTTTALLSANIVPSFSDVV